MVLLVGFAACYHTATKTFLHRDVITLLKLAYESCLNKMVPKCRCLVNFFTINLLTMCAYTVCMCIVVLCLQLEVKLDLVIDCFA